MVCLLGRDTVRARRADKGASDDAGRGLRSRSRSRSTCRSSSGLFLFLLYPSPSVPRISMSASKSRSSMASGLGGEGCVAVAVAAAARGHASARDGSQGVGSGASSGVQLRVMGGGTCPGRSSTTPLNKTRWDRSEARRVPLLNHDLVHPSTLADKLWGIFTTTYSSLTIRVLSVDLKI